MTDLETARQALRDHAAIGAVGPMFERLLAEVERLAQAHAWREGFTDGRDDSYVVAPACPYREDT